MNKLDKFLSYVVCSVFFVIVAGLVVYGLDKTKYTKIIIEQQDNFNKQSKLFNECLDAQVKENWSAGYEAGYLNSSIDSFYNKNLYRIENKDNKVTIWENNSEFDAPKVITHFNNPESSKDLIKNLDKPIVNKSKK